MAHSGPSHLSSIGSVETKSTDMAFSYDLYFDVLIAEMRLSSNPKVLLDTAEEFIPLCHKRLEKLISHKTKLIAHYYKLYDWVNYDRCCLEFISICNEHKQDALPACEEYLIYLIEVCRRLDTQHYPEDILSAEKIMELMKLLIKNGLCLNPDEKLIQIHQVLRESYVNGAIHPDGKIDKKLALKAAITCGLEIEFIRKMLDKDKYVDRLRETHRIHLDLLEKIGQKDKAKQKQQEYAQEIEKLSLEKKAAEEKFLAQTKESKLETQPISPEEIARDAPRTIPTDEKSPKSPAPVVNTKEKIIAQMKDLIEKDLKRAKENKIPEEEVKKAAQFIYEKNLALSKQDFKGAIVLCENALKSCNNTPIQLAHIGLCQAYYKLSPPDYQNLLKQATILVDQFSASTSLGFIFRGLCYLNNKNYAKAYNDFIRAIRAENTSSTKTITTDIRNALFAALFECEKQRGFKRDTSVTDKYKLVLVAHRDLKEGIACRRDNPQQALALFNKSEALLSQALVLATREPFETDLLFSRSIARFNKKNFKGALNDLHVAYWICTLQKSKLQAGAQRDLELINSKLAKYAAKAEEFTVLQNEEAKATAALAEAKHYTGGEIKLNPAAADCITRLKAKGAFLTAAVGGIVRDPIINRDIIKSKKSPKGITKQVVDNDIVTNATESQIRAAYPEREGFRVEKSKFVAGLYTIIGPNGEIPEQHIQIMQSKYLSEAKYGSNPYYFDALNRDFYHNAVYCNEHGKLIVPLKKTLEVLKTKTISIIDRRELFDLEGKSTAGKTSAQLAYEEDSKRLWRGRLTEITYPGFKCDDEFNESIPLGLSLLHNSPSTINALLFDKLFSRIDAKDIFNALTQIEFNALFPGLVFALKFNKEFEGSILPGVRGFENYLQLLQNIINNELFLETIYASFIILENLSLFASFTETQIQELQDDSKLNKLFTGLAEKNPLYKACFADYQIKKADFDARTGFKLPELTTTFRTCMEKIMRPAVKSIVEEKDREVKTQPHSPQSPQSPFYFSYNGLEFQPRPGLLRSSYQDHRLFNQLYNPRSPVHIAARPEAMQKMKAADMQRKQLSAGQRVPLRHFASAPLPKHSQAIDPALQSVSAKV